VGVDAYGRARTSSYTLRRDCGAIRVDQGTHSLTHSLTLTLSLTPQGIFNWKSHYDTAVLMCNQAIAALAAREAGIPQIEAMLLQAKLLMEDPEPAKDVRARFKVSNGRGC
jgi:hypothetical protein